MVRVWCFWLLLGGLIYVGGGMAQGVDGISQPQPLKYNPAFDGIGPKVYVLPPPKTAQELLEERYIRKWQSLSQVEHTIAFMEMQKQLIYLPEPERPLGIREVDWEIFSEKQRLDRALLYYTTHPDYYALAQIQNNLGNYYFLEGNLIQADSLYKSSLTHTRHFGADSTKAAVLDNLIRLKLRLRDYESALNYFQQLLDRPGLESNLDYQASLFLEIAKIESSLGHYAAAQRIGLNKSITLFKRTGNFKGIVRSLNVLASFMEQQNKYVEAKWYYLQAIDVAKENEDDIGLACSLYHLASLKNTIGDYSLAVADFKQAGALAETLSMKVLLLKVKNELGDSYLKLGDYTAANLLLEEYNHIKTDLLQQTMRIN